jgi:hypothetical protein
MHWRSWRSSRQADLESRAGSSAGAVRDANSVIGQFHLRAATQFVAWREIEMEEDTAARSPESQRRGRLRLRQRRRVIAVQAARAGYRGDGSLGKEAARAFSALEAAGTRARQVEFEFDTWRLVAQDLGEGLLLVCRPGVDSALLRMSPTCHRHMEGGFTPEAADEAQGATQPTVEQSQLDAPAWTSWRLLESRG